MEMMEMIQQARYYLVETHHDHSLSLLEEAVAKAATVSSYARELEDALCHGSTVELRKILSVFGDYFRPDYSLLPEERHCNRVNGIDNAMHYVKRGEVEDGIEFYNALHSY